MQKPISKIILFGLFLLHCIGLKSQTRLRFETEDGFVVREPTVQAWTPFGVEIFPVKDSLTGDFLIYKNCNRLKVLADGFYPLDTFFKPELVVGAQLVLRLKAKFNIMDEAVISTSKSESKLKESPVSITILKPYLTENKVATDLSQSLDQVPGVNIADNQVNIRSGNGWSYGAGSRVAVLLDDLPMLSADAQAAQFSFMPLEFIESVEIVKSAGSVLYGSSALNGVVNLRMKEASIKPEGKFTSFVGIYDQPSKASLRWRTGPAVILGSSGYSSFTVKNTGMVVMFNLLNNQGYRMNEFEKRARISFRSKTHSQKIPGLEWGQNTSIQSGKSGSFLLWQNYDQGYITLDSGYNFSNSKKLSVDPFVTYKSARFTHKFIGRGLFLDNNIENGDTQNQDNSSSLFYAEYRLSTWMLNQHLHITGGLVSSHGNTHSPSFSGTQMSNNRAAYLQTDWKVNRLNFQAGARYEYYQLNQFKQSRPVFRMGLSYAAARFTFLRASWGQGYRFPSMGESFIATSAGNIHIYPNPKLKPESGSNAEIGLKQGYRIGNFKAYADVSGFYTVYHDLMEFTFAQWADFSSPLLGFGFKSVNTAKASISGFEIETAGQGSTGNIQWQLLAGYTYTQPISVSPQAEFVKDFNGNPLTFANTRADSNAYLKYRYKHLLRADIQARIGDWEPGLSVRYNSRMLNMDNSFVSLIDPSIRTAWDGLKGAKVMDLRLAWVPNEQFRLNFQVTNVFNAIFMNRPADLRPPRAFQLQGVLKW